MTERMLAADGFLDGVKSLATRRRKTLILSGYAALTLACCSVMAKVWDNVVYTFTDSVPATVLLKTPNVEVGKRDYLLVDVNHSYMPQEIPRVTKTALCLPGDKLSFDGLNFYCEGVWLHRVKPETKLGFPLDAFAWEGGTVPEGFVYFGSDHPDGFDSRYLGFAPLADVTRLKVLL